MAAKKPVLQKVKPIVERKVTIENPVGINSSYVVVRDRYRGKMAKSKRAQDYQDRAVHNLRKAGFVALPERPYYASIVVHLYSSRLDLDGPLKSTIDAVMKSTSIAERVGKRTIYRGWDDKWLGEAHLVKFPEPKRDSQRVELTISIYPIRDRAHFWEFSQYVANKIEGMREIITVFMFNGYDR